MYPPASIAFFFFLHPVNFLSLSCFCSPIPIEVEAVFPLGAVCFLALNLLIDLQRQNRLLFFVHLAASHQV